MGRRAVSDLTRLYDEINQCQRCPLGRTRTRAVPGEGPEDAKIVFIGEAPGFHEDQQGRPFVGAAGHFLEQLLASIGMKRRDVYICNIIKCRPPGNRDPLPNEIQACAEFLDRQIALIKPRVIVTLGRYSMAKYLPQASISRVHGRPQRVGDIIVLPLYHPAAALHRPRYKADIEEDFKKIPALLQESIALDETPPPAGPVEAEQLRLF
ncbi:MAG: uracil-DNA glycosylase [Anaerolineae bacterium]|nr:uracil-DNA glycosylase [Anaerolineae bacterium]